MCLRKHHHTLGAVQIRPIRDPKRYFEILSGRNRPVPFDDPEIGPPEVIPVLPLGRCYPAGDRMLLL